MQKAKGDKTGGVASRALCLKTAKTTILANHLSESSKTLKLRL